MARTRPTVGITADLIDHNGFERAAVPTTYVSAVAHAGGLPVLLPPFADLASEFISRCDAIVLTGGDDPAMEPFGEQTDERVTLVRAERQTAESSLIQTIEQTRPEIPVLGVCLGMQMMALHAGGALEQHMPESVPTHADHWGAVHPIVSVDEDVLPSGIVASNHRQAVTDAGTMAIIARANDGVVEAIKANDRPFYLGVQWHPERSPESGLGLDLFRRLVQSCS